MKKLYLIFMAAITMFAVMSCANPAGGGGIDNNFPPEQPRWSSIEEYAETHTIDMRDHGEKSKAYELGSNVKILVQKDMDMYFFQAIVESHMKDESVLFFDPHGEEYDLYFKPTVQPNEQELILYILPKNSVYYYHHNDNDPIVETLPENSINSYYDMCRFNFMIEAFRVRYRE